MRALKLLVGEGCEVGFARQVAAHSSDGVFDAAFLPGRVGVAEEGLEAELVELVVAGELGAVVEGDGLSHGRGGIGSRMRRRAVDDGVGGLVGLGGGRGGCASERSWRARMAWPYLAKSMRSASQWPGCLRSPASAGRSAMGTRPSMRLDGAAAAAAAEPRLTWRGADSGARRSRWCGRSGHR